MCFDLKQLTLGHPPQVVIGVCEKILILPKEGGEGKGEEGEEEEEEDKEKEEEEEEAAAAEEEE